MPNIRDAHRHAMKMIGLALQHIPTHHAHVCACGTTLECSRADCAVSDPYECPNCERDRMDEFIDQLEADRADSRNR